MGGGGGPGNLQAGFGETYTPPTGGSATVAPVICQPAVADARESSWSLLSAMVNEVSRRGEGCREGDGLREQSKVSSSVRS